MKTRTLAAVAAALTLVLSGCGGGGGGTESAQTAASTASLVPPAEGKITYPLTLPTKWGDITIEKRPERIVAGDDWEIDLLAALGVTPVGTNDQDAFRAYATKLMPGKIAATWSNDEVAFPAEPILATTPDLIDIVGGEAKPDNYDELVKIAPVLGPPPVAAELVPWEDRLRQLGRALDLSDRAEQAITGNTEYFTKLRAEHPEFAGKTAVYLNFWGEYGTGYLSTPGTGSTTLFTAYGFAANPDAARFEGIDTLSRELIGSIKGDARSPLIEGI